MVASYEVDRAALATLIARLADVTEFTTELIGQIEAVKQTVSAEWSGEANAEYQALHAQWMDGARAMSAGAERITTHAGLAAGNYDEVAGHVRALWG